MRKNLHVCLLCLLVACGPGRAEEQASGRAGEATARARLLEALTAESFPVRLAAAVELSHGIVLGTPAEKPVKAVLLAGLSYTDAVWRAEAARSVANLDVMPEVVPLLLALLADPAAEPRQRAALTLGNYHACTNTLFPGVVKFAAHSNAAVRATAVGLLANQRLELGAAALPHLLVALRDDDASVRQAALAGFNQQQAGDGQIIAAVARVASVDPDPAVRRLAVETLGALGPQAVPDLLELIGKADEVFQEKVVTALGRNVRNSDAAVQGVIRVLQDETAGYDVRYTAVYMLREAGPAGSNAVPAVRRLLSYPAAQMQMNAAETLRQIAPAR